MQWAKKGKRGFWRSKVHRLVIPLLAGIFIFSPPQVYFERLQGGDFSGNFFQFFPYYFDGWYGFGGNFAWMGLHLWYVMALLIFFLASAPLTTWINKIPFDNVTHRLWSPLLFLIPLIFIELFINQWPQTWGNKILGGWSIFTYYYFFLVGYIFCRISGIEESFQRLAWPAIGVAAGLYVMEGLLNTLEMANRSTLVGYMYSLLITVYS